jgi:hypothetical protein
VTSSSPEDPKSDRLLGADLTAGAWCLGAMVVQIRRLVFVPQWLYGEERLDSTVGTVRETPDFELA